MKVAKRISILSCFWTAMTVLMTISSGYGQSSPSLQEHLRKIPFAQRADMVTEIANSDKATNASIGGGEVSPNKKMYAYTVYTSVDHDTVKKSIVNLFNLQTLETQLVLASDEKDKVKHPLYPSGVLWSPDSIHLYIFMGFQDAVTYGEWHPFDVVKKKFTEEAEKRLDLMRNQREKLGNIGVPHDLRLQPPAWSQDGRYFACAFYAEREGIASEAQWVNPATVRDFRSRLKIGEYDIFASLKRWEDSPSPKEDPLRYKYHEYVFRDAKHVETLKLATTEFPLSTLITYEDDHLIIYRFTGDRNWKIDFGSQIFTQWYSGNNDGFILYTKDEKGEHLYWIKQSMGKK